MRGLNPHLLYRMHHATEVVTKGYFFFFYFWLAGQGLQKENLFLCRINISVNVNVAQRYEHSC